MQEKHVVKILITATIGDQDFYSRWLQIGSLEGPDDGNDDVTILVVDFRTEVTEAFLDQYPNLKYVVSPTTGHTHLKANFWKRNIQLVTLRGETEFLRTVRSVSEFVFCQILQFARPPFRMGQLLSGSTLGIIGCKGRIGTHVYDLAAAFGMKIIGVDIGTPSSAWERLYRESDYITIHVDENPTTRGLVGYQQFAMMKRTVFLVNTSRESVIDSKALLYALQKQQIAGAALDVWGGYDYPGLWLSKHVAGSTVKDRIRTDNFIVEKLKRIIMAEESRQSPTTTEPKPS